MSLFSVYAVKYICIYAFFQTQKLKKLFGYYEAQDEELEVATIELKGLMKFSNTTSKNMYSSGEKTLFYAFNKQTIGAELNGGSTISSTYGLGVNYKDFNFEIFVDSSAMSVGASIGIKDMFELGVSIGYGGISAWFTFTYGNVSHTFKAEFSWIGLVLGFVIAIAVWLGFVPAFA